MVDALSAAPPRRGALPRWCAPPPLAVPRADNPRGLGMHDRVLVDGCWSTRRRLGQFQARLHAELAIDVARVGADRLDTDVQRRGDLRVGAALLEHDNQLGLAWGQQVRSRR